MRVLTTTICYPTASRPAQGVFVARRAQALAALPGVEVRVAAPRLWCPLLRRAGRAETGATENGHARREPVAGAKNDSLPVVSPRMLSVPVLGWGLDGVAFGRALERAVRELEQREGWRPDMIDAHFVYPDGVGAWLAARRLGIPVTVTVRGKIVSLSRTRVRRMQITRMLHGVDAIFAVSRSLVSYVHEVAGAALPVEVIPNGIDTGTFAPTDRDAARRRLGWNPHTRYLLAVGHLQRVKGFDRLLTVLPTVRAALGEVRVILVGSDRGERSFRRQVLSTIRRLNESRDGASEEPIVRWIGSVPAERLALMYNAADLTVCPSRSEGWCNAIHESLACGTPVVAFDVGGNGEQIHSPSLGRVVPEGDLAALTRAIVISLTHGWNRSEIAYCGSERTWARVAEEVRAGLGRVIGGSAFTNAAAPAAASMAPTVSMASVTVGTAGVRP